MESILELEYLYQLNQIEEEQKLFEFVYQYDSSIILNESVSIKDMAINIFKIFLNKIKIIRNFIKDIIDKITDKVRYNKACKILDKVKNSNIKFNMYKVNYGFTIKVVDSIYVNSNNLTVTDIAKTLRTLEDYFIKKSMEKSSDKYVDDIKQQINQLKNILDSGYGYIFKHNAFSGIKTVEELKKVLNDNIVVEEEQEIIMTPDIANHIKKDLKIFEDLKYSLKKNFAEVDKFANDMETTTNFIMGKLNNLEGEISEGLSFTKQLYLYVLRYMNIQRSALVAVLESVNKQQNIVFKNINTITNQIADNTPKGIESK